MLLDELYGFKKELPKINALKKQLSKLTPKSSLEQRHSLLEEFLTYLEDLGFTPLGSGSFGAVFTKPGLNYVLKIFKNDPAYLHFLRFCLANRGDPHLPVFRGKFIKIDKKHYCVRMETLQRMTGDTNRKIWTLFSRFIHTSLPISDFVERLKPEDRDLLETTGNMGMFSTLKYLKMSTNGFAVDLHDENIMFRGSVLVITDPYADMAQLHG